MKPALRIIEPGAHTTVQDLGRTGKRSWGVADGGAVDPISLRIANLLVGNDEDAAALECALLGPTLRFNTRVTVALCGGHSRSVLNGAAVQLRANQTFTIGPLAQHTYAYLAVGGGIDVPAVLGSRSTDTRIGWGGLEGRRLQGGDRLPLGDPPHVKTPRRVNATAFLDTTGAIRVLPGKDAKRIDDDWLDRAYRVSPQSDRMGMRLHAEPVAFSPPADAASSIVLPGTIQLPPDGQPIVLLSDAQTLGGYPQIAHVIDADLARLAQRPPGSFVRFEAVTLEVAHKLSRRREQDLAFLRYGLSSGGAR